MKICTDSKGFHSLTINEDVNGNEFGATIFDHGSRHSRAMTYACISGVAESNTNDINCSEVIGVTGVAGSNDSNISYNPAGVVDVNQSEVVVIDTIECNRIRFSK